MVRLGEKCTSLPPSALHELEKLLKNGARDFTWVPKGILNLPNIYLSDPVKFKGSPKSTHDMCLWVMKLSSSVMTHLLDFRIQIFNNCWLLITLKNTSKYWVFCCSEAAQVFDI